VTFFGRTSKNQVNHGKQNISYLSAIVCEEFIKLIVQHVLCPILDEIKETKYYSMNVDSTNKCGFP